VAVLGWWLSSHWGPTGSSTGAGPGGKGRAALAVLPLTNIGGGADDGFTVGLHSDIITRLAKLASLKVISRESVLEYAGSKKNLRQIGEELGVASVLTGEVQRAGNELRLNVTLRAAATDENLWAESYNRELTARGILSVQSEIAEAVARALAASLSPTERANLRALPTTNDKAYELYLAGSPLAEGPTSDDSRRSLAALTQAVELDPKFAQAWASLGVAHAFAHWRYDVNKGHLDQGFAAARQSLAIAGDLAEGHIGLGTCHYVNRDYDAALAEFELAERAQPGMPMALKMKGYLHRRVGKWDKSIAEIAIVLDQSPRDAFLLSNQAISLTYMRRYAEAESLFLRSRAAGETLENLGAYVQMCMSRDGDARSVAALSDYMAAHPEQRDMQPMQEIVRARFMAHDYARVHVDLEGMPERMASQTHDQPKSLLLAIADDLAGERDKAAAEYETSRQALATWLAATPDDNRLQASMGYALAGLGRRDEALRAGRRAVELLPVERDALVGTIRLLDLCLIAARAGALDEAMQYLEQYQSQPTQVSIRALALDPRLSPLRELPRFKALEQAFAAK
jgi:TolB-like protein/tetratricopeptide (TPR) repeat protein